jgi:8-oxo-dGTP pyrophosphatase MutT (NUDIX family)
MPGEAHDRMKREHQVTRAEVIDRLQAPRAGAVRRHGLAAGARGDYDMNDEDMRHPGPLTPAAVLVPLVERSDGMTVLLTQRTEHLNDHAGQVSFPGGRIEPGDDSPEAAALREAFEEVGLPGEFVTPIGRLDDYETRTGFLIHPVVGLVAPGFPVRPDPFEVADVFEVPLAIVLDRANHLLERGSFKGRERQFYVLRFAGRHIWGATAGMLVNLCDVVAG